MGALGRPLTPLDPSVGAAAALGAEVRRLRLAHKLTQATLGILVGYSPQHLSDLELGRTSVTRDCVGALDATLGAQGALLALLPAATLERAFAAQAHAAERRYDEDVDPTNRRGLLEAGTAAALGAAALTPAPAAAHEIDPELPAHWAALLRLLGRHDEIFGPRDVLATVRHQLGLIAKHRELARGELRTQLLRVEARWADLAAWLSEDTGQSRARDTWTDRALRLAQEAGYSDMIALARGRQVWYAAASNGRRAVALAEDALRVQGTSAQTRAWCSRQAALGYAMAGEASACERRLADAYGLLDDESLAPPWAGEYRVARAGTLADEARCWAALNPAKAIGLYDNALRDWPRAEARDGGVQRARMALACAKAGEHDRARAEGRKALAIARQTRSATTARELKRLGAVLGTP